MPRHQKNTSNTRNTAASAGHEARLWPRADALLRHPDDRLTIRLFPCCANSKVAVEHARQHLKQPPGADFMLANTPGKISDLRGERRQYPEPPATRPAEPSPAPCRGLT